MKIINLMENTEGYPGCVYEHGLSFYIETPKHKILLDTGATDKLLENAKVLGIDLTQVDTLVLSHGHYDHSGGILAVVAINPHMKIYMQRSAAQEYYHPTPEEERYIGVDKRILDLPQLVLLDGNYRLDEELSLFTNITGRRLWPQGNLSLKRKTEEGFEQDNFEHEQCLVIEAEGQQILLSGCAHNGILNILDKYRELYASEPDAVISGFHMMKKTEYTPQEMQNIRATAEELMKYKSHFYTGHCTGETAFAWMKEIMGEQLTYVHCGDRVFLASEEEAGSWKELLVRINNLPEGHHIIAIDGRCAAGKSTLAEWLAQNLKAGVVHMDDFFLPMELRTPERLAEPGGNVHYERFQKEVLPFLEEGRGFAYRKLDCSTMLLGEERVIPPSRFTIVEGAYSCHPVLGQYMSLRIFLNVESELQYERIRRRNGEEKLKVFQEKWIPMEEAYFKAFQIAGTADVTMTLSGYMVEGVSKNSKR